MNKQQFRKSLGLKNPMEMWKLVQETYKRDQDGYYLKDEKGDLIKTNETIFVLVNTENGQVQQFQQTDNYVSESIKDGSVTPYEMFGCNGFKRMRLAEEGLKEINEEN